MRRVYLDACVVIYLIENSVPFSEKTRQFLARNSDAHLCVSPLVRMEVMLKPLRDSATTLACDYEDFLAAQHWFAIALHHGCDEFWTNDDRLNKAAGVMAVNIFSA